MVALPFRRPLAGVAPGHLGTVIRQPRSVPAPGQPAGTPVNPLVPPWLLRARSGIGSAYAASHRKP